MSPAPMVQKLLYWHVASPPADMHLPVFNCAYSRLARVVIHVHTSNQWPAIRVPFPFSVFLSKLD